MRIRAAVVEKKSSPFIFRDLELDAPRPDEILVRIVATGVCQTDAHARAQDRAVPLPVVLGHEGAGVVEKAGNEVTGFAPGDHVVLSYQSCGTCKPCLTGHGSYCTHAFQLCFGAARLDGSNALHGARGHFFGQSSFATYALTTTRNTVKVPKDVPLEMLGPLGCGMQTGAGAVLNSLKVPSGASIVVIGTGAVGSAAIMAARIAGASPIIAVDINEQRLALAADLGATHTVNPAKEDTSNRIMTVVPGGVDYALEITGRPQMLKLAVNVLAPMGTAALIGGSPDRAEAPIDMHRLLFGRHLRGIVQGDATPQIFIPKLMDWYRSGKFPFDRLLRFYDFEQIEEAFRDAKAGTTVKPVLRISSP